MSKHSITSSSSVDNASVTNFSTLNSDLQSVQPTQDDMSAVAVPTSPNVSVTLPINPPAGAANALLPKQKAKSAKTVPRTDNAPPEEPTATSEAPTPPAVTTMEFHPLSVMFPGLGKEEMDKFCADISTNGLREQITTYQGKILDGRNRFTACAITGITPKFKEYEGDDPLGFVLSKNLHRRHLSESQRAMTAAKLATMKQGERKKIKPANLPVSESGENQDLAAQSLAISQSEAAKMLNVSEKLVRNAVKLRKEGTREVIELVEQGKKTVNAALSNGKPKPNNGKPSAEKPVEKDAGSVDTAPAVNTSSKGSKGSAASTALNDRLLAEMKTALELSANSAQQSDAFLNVVKTVISNVFTRTTVRRDFLGRVQTVIDEYGV